MGKIKLVIVDDHPIVREGIAGILMGSEFVVLGEAGNGREGLEIIGTINPDIVLVDKNMPLMNGIELLDNARNLFPEIKFVMISSDNDPVYVKKVMKKGASGFLSKNINRVDFIKALQQIKQGRKFFNDNFDLGSNGSGTDFLSKVPYLAQAGVGAPIKINRWIYDFFKAFIVEISAAVLLALIAFGGNQPKYSIKEIKEVNALEIKETAVRDSLFIDPDNFEIQNDIPLFIRIN